MRALKRYTGTIRDLHNIFLILCLLFGGYFVLQTPLLWGSDETFHTMRVYQITQGNLRSDYLGNTREQGGYGGEIPGNLHSLVLTVNHDQFDNNPHDAAYGRKEVDSREWYNDLGKKKLWGGETVVYAFPNTAAYSPVSYLPYIGGMLVAEHGDFNIRAAVILMRALGLLTYAAIVYYALRMLARSTLKWVLFVVGLMPMAVFQASIISIDSLIIATCLLLFALVAKALTAKKPLTLAEKTALFACVALVPLLKPGYIFLSLAVLLVPRVALGPGRAATAFKSLSLAAALLLFGGWALLTKDVSSTIALIKPVNPVYGVEQIDTREQTEYILKNPLRYTQTLARNSMLNDNRYFTEMVGTMGFNAVAVPGLVVLLQVIMWLLVLARADTAGVRARNGLYLIAMAALCWLIIITTLYVTYSAVGAPEVSGIQGRYFLPLMPFILGGLAIIVNGRLKTVKNEAFPAFIVAGASLCLFLSTLKYFYITG